MSRRAAAPQAQFGFARPVARPTALLAKTGPQVKQLFLPGKRAIDVLVAAIALEIE